MTAAPLPDLFSIIHKAFVEAMTDGTIQPPDFPATPAVATPYKPAADTADEFITFARAYLQFNPILGAGSSLGAYGVVLADRRQVMLTNQQPVFTGGWSGSIPFGGHQQVTSSDRLPPANDIPFGGKP